MASFCTMNKPTRVTNHSATLIDHIWTNNFANYVCSGIIFNSVNDHFPIISSFSSSKSESTSKPITFATRKFTNENIGAFKTELIDFDGNVLQNNDVNYIFDEWL